MKDLKYKADKLNQEIEQSGIDHNIPIVKKINVGDTIKHTSEHGTVTEYIIEEEETKTAHFLDENKYVVMCGYIAFPDVKGLNQTLRLKEVLTGNQRALYRPKKLTIINRVA